MRDVFNKFSLIQSVFFNKPFTENFSFSMIQKGAIYHKIEKRTKIRDIYLYISNCILQPIIYI